MPHEVLPGLPDYIAPGLRVLFVGINPGLRSAQVGHHYAGPSNRFWKLLTASQLIPIPLTYRDDVRVLEWGIGLTNLVARPTAGAHELTQEDYEGGRKVLMKAITAYQPQVIALLGLGIGRLLLFESSGQKRASSQQGRTLTPGLQPVLLQHIPVFVLPNPSGRNAHYSYQTMRQLFQDLAQLVVSLSEG